MVYRCMFCGALVQSCGKPVEAVLTTSTPEGVPIGLRTILPCGCFSGHKGPCAGNCGPSCRCLYAGQVHPLDCGCGAELESSATCDLCKPFVDWDAMTCSRPIKRPERK